MLQERDTNKKKERNYIFTLPLFRPRLSGNLKVSSFSSKRFSVVTKKAKIILTLFLRRFYKYTFVHCIIRILPVIHLLADVCSFRLFCFFLLICWKNCFWKFKPCFSDSSELFDLLIQHARLSSIFDAKPRTRIG